MSDTVVRSNEEIAGYYDYMGPFFAILFGESNHMGLWADGTDQTISEAQDRLTQAIIEATGLGSGQRLLDVGCGNGRPAVLAARQTGASVVGVNLSQVQVEEANKLASEAGLGDRVSFAVEDGMKLPHADGSFDAVWAVECLSHMPDRTAALREMLRVLRPGGRLVVTDLTEKAPLTEEQREMLFGAFLMASIVRTGDYAGVVAGAGFTDVSARDLSDQVAPTLTKVLEQYPAKRAAIAEAYGDEMANELANDFPVFSAMQRDSLGYVLVTARKPGA